MARITAIGVEIIAEHLFGDPGGYDVAASAGRYADLLSKALTRRFPGVAISTPVCSGVSGRAGAVEIVCDDGNVYTRANPDMAFWAVEDIVSVVYETEDWCVYS